MHANFGWIISKKIWQKNLIGVHAASTLESYVKNEEHENSDNRHGAHLEQCQFKAK